jgi:hypothetical protein
VNLEDLTTEQFDRAIQLDIRRLDLQEREFEARQVEWKAIDLREREKQVAWEEHAAKIEEHSRITHEMLARIAAALEAQVGG